jgi:alpha-L-rhamnosidase
LEHIVRDIRERGDHLSTGFIGTAYLMPTLAEMGQQELAFRLATQRTYPSWGYTVEQGATTIWELWNADTTGPAMNSRNHFAFGAVAQWFYESLGGIRPDPQQPGFKRIIIRPQPPRELAWAWAEYPSVHGLVRSAWHREGERFVLDVRVPANTTAEVYVPLPAERKPTIRAGEHLLLRAGQVEGASAGLRFERLEGSCAIFEAAAGEYRFVVESP